MSPLPTNKRGVNFSLKGILGNQFDKFMADMVYSPIEKWALEGKIDSVTLRRLNRVLRKHGNEALNVPAEQIAQATRHSMEGGELFRVNLPITGDLSIDNFVKIFSSYDKFKDAIKKEQRIYDALQGTELESHVVQPLFINREMSLVSYPFVNAATLQDVVQEATSHEKEKLLVDVLKDYQHVSEELTSRRDKVESDGYNLGSLMGFDECFDKFFFKRLGHENGDTDELRELFSKYFAPLEGQNNHIIHGDLIMDNVILEGDHSVFIDPEDACIGFLEFDYCKLLTKAGLSEEAEESVVRKAAENACGTEEDVKESEKRYALNRIAQELFTSVRYLKRARENSSESMANMALVSYNIALRKIDRAIERGYVGQDLKECLEKFVSEHHSDQLYDLGDKFEEYKEKFNPHFRKSQDNVVSAPSLDLLITGQDDKKDVKSELKHLRRNLSRRKRNWTKILAYSLAGVLAVGAIGGLRLYEKITQKAQEREVYLESEEMFKDLMLIERGQATASNDTILLQNDIRSLEDKFGGDKGAAYCWLINPVATYEAMQETGSQSYGDLKAYLMENWDKIPEPNPYHQVDSLLRKGEIYDNWMLTFDTKYPPIRFEKALEKAKEAYEKKKQKENVPDPNLNI